MLDLSFRTLLTKRNLKNKVTELYLRVLMVPLQGFLIVIMEIKGIRHNYRYTID